MDILKPDVMWIEQRCYRINPRDSSIQIDNGERFDKDEFTEENLECPVEEPNEDFDIEITENGNYKTSFRVPKFYFAMVIGPKGAVKHRLEDETKTQIRVPKQGFEGNIVITGSSKSGVSTARRRIDLIVMSARWRQQFTHFISLPMNGVTIKKRYLEFKEKVLEYCCNSRGIDASIFQSPEKLHLTLGTLVLMDTDEREKAAHALEECKETIIDPLLRNRSLPLSMVGIEYMNDDPAEVDVLYGKVFMKNDSDILQELSDRTVDFFTSKGLMQKQYDRVKLHVTLMNTLFRNEDSSASDHETSKRKQKPRESFDATSILKNFENFDFGSYTVEEMHLSLRYSKSSNGYYQASAQIKLA
ncbi:hypothetical protein L9F63_006466 [Diploptera punctata]|uniref:K Homology domain-containing protein n=1 Tax=Diploptera punctata TaxID=6984 RepID=A0AAD8E4H7_DIPPU|nr:hypothetical protein L9F63_006466 [Diploptera punctata]